ncbi:hypothetical protein ACFONG_20320 [Uliginosibacterium paludis]|uniref:Uncharacterized protein n=1 Tax=Uliginosibacterium paludis TaxID=1615952 RepID=A0ABV2CXC3_9RHOO
MKPIDFRRFASPDRKRAGFIVLALGALLIAGTGWLSAGPSSEELKAARNEACNHDPHCLRP